MLKLTNKPFRNIKIVLLAIIAISPILAIGYLCYPKSNPKGDLSHRQEAERRLKAIQERLDKPITPPLTRYQQLDEAIDRYLSLMQSENLTDAGAELARASKIAEEMETKTGDRWGRDLVSYYQNIDSTKIDQLTAARQLRSEIALNASIAVTNQIGESIQKLKEIREIFTRYSAGAEVETTSVLLAKYLIKSDATEEATKLIAVALQDSTSHHHLFIRADLLHWKGELLSNTTNFNGALDALEESRRIASTLDVPNFIIQPYILLASIYWTMDDNQRAFDQAIATLKVATENNIPIPIQTLQILGISAYGLNYSSLSEEYLQQAITRSIKLKHIPHLAMSYSLAGIVKAEQHKIGEAEESLNKAITSVETIPDIAARERAKFAVVGYQARVKMLAGKADEAIALYQEALELGERTNCQQMLTLSQLHQGLGECFITKGNLIVAKKELTNAVVLDNKARQNFEVGNSLLTYAVSHIPSAEQLLRLQQSN